MTPVFFYYTLWHYSRAPRDILRIWMNFLWFFYNFFSIPLLLLSLFAPWERMDESYKKGLDLGAIGETIIVNMLMRIVGFVVRIFTIALGTTALIAVFVGGLAFFLFWLMAPVMLVALLAIGAYLVIS